MACGSDDETAALPDFADDVVSNYADIVYASYQDSLSAAQALDTSVTALVNGPSDATFTAAQTAWRASREPYLQTEVYRFYDGPIDNEDGPEGLLNAWPLDENYIDYVQGDDDAGLVNDPQVPLTPEAIESRNELAGEKNISTGYHAVEFLLWGQDFNDQGPGQRPFTDYATGASATAQNQARRGQYATTASGLIVEHLEGLVEAWAPNVTGNFRDDFEAEDPAVAISSIMSGMIILTGFETGQERLEAALAAADQEEEHSCFSDNTHRDMIQDVRGVQNVWLGRYQKLDGSTESGQGIRDLIAEADEDLADEVTAQIETSLALAEDLEVPFDRAIQPDNAAGRAGVEALSLALFDQRDLLEQAFEVYGLTRRPDPE
jgi:putative iron-regulated protein